MTNNKQSSIESLLDKIQLSQTTFTDSDGNKYIFLYPIFNINDIEQCKEMEKEKHEKFNKFLNDEKQLGISDLKTIERIQWYYNTYFNETYGGGEQ
jgi:hypothetical protein